MQLALECCDIISIISDERAFIIFSAGKNETAVCHVPENEISNCYNFSSMNLYSSMIF